MCKRPIAVRSTLQLFLISKRIRLPLKSRQRPLACELQTCIVKAQDLIPPPSVACGCHYKQHKEPQMNTATRFILFALAFNIIVLVPVVSVLMLDLTAAGRGFGLLTDGRLILTSIYMAIAIISAALIVMHVKRLTWAMPMSVALFAVQITYKLITVPMVGLSNPVVISNIVVVAVQVVALTNLWRALRGSKAAL
jgi:hypothetical protein